MKLVKLKVVQDRIAENIEPEKLVRAFVLARYRGIMEQREEIVAAFIAKHGCHPDDAVQVVERLNGKTEVFYVMHKSKYKPKRDRLIREELKRILSEDD